VLKATVFLNQSVVAVKYLTYSAFGMTGSSLISVVNEASSLFESPIGEKPTNGNASA
jgi:hypothetical protein